VLDYFLTIGNERIDNFGSLTWNDDIESFTTILNFTSQIPLNIGRQIALNNGDEQLLRCIITDRNYDRNLIFSYTAHDFGFYLSQNEIVRQCRGNIDTEIRRILESVNIPVGRIENVRGTVKNIYKDKTVKDVLTDLLNLATGQTGFNYTVDCRLGEVNIRPYRLINDLQGDLSNDIQINSGDNLGNVTITNSMQSMKNRILVVTGNEQNTRISAREFDQTSIERFGLLQEIISADNEQGNFNILARTRLREANRITTTITVDLLGDDRIQKGVLIPIEDERVNINGIYLVRTSEHKVENGQHTVHCELALEE